MDYTFLVVIGAVVAITLVVRWWRPSQVDKRRLARGRAVAMRDLVPDAVQKVTGIVEPIVPIKSPLTWHRCVYWHVVVEEHNESWSVVGQEVESCPFWLVDGTGRVYVDLADVDVHLDLHDEGSTSFFSGATDLELAMLERLGVRATGSFGASKTLRFKEARLDVGERVSIEGKVAIGEVGGRAVYAMVRGPRRLRVSDHPTAHG